MTQHPFHARAGEPFRFVDFEGLVMPTGFSAANLKELASIVHHVPAEVIHHHVVRSPLGHRFGSWDYPNDFSQWAAHSLEDLALAEKLASIDPYARRDVEALRGEIVNLLEDHLDELPMVPWARPGREFHFARGHFLALPGEHTAWTLAEMRDTLAQIPLSSLFFHFEEARLSHGDDDADDFSRWIEDQFGDHPLVAQLRRIDFYLYSLADLRVRIVGAFDAHRGEAVP